MNLYLWQDASSGYHQPPKTPWPHFGISHPRHSDHIILASAAQDTLTTPFCHQSPKTDWPHFFSMQAVYKQQDILLRWDTSSHTSEQKASLYRNGLCIWNVEHSWQMLKYSSILNEKWTGRHTYKLPNWMILNRRFLLHSQWNTNKCVYTYLNNVSWVQSVEYYQNNQQLITQK